MNVPLIISALVFCTSARLMKAQSLERQVIASAGSSVSLDFTIGEVVVSTQNLEVTTGFQQGELFENPPLDVEDITERLTVYPVPTKDVLTIQGEGFSAESTNVTLFSPEGRRVQITVESGSSHVRLDLGNIPAGHYYLKLHDATHKKIANYKILKIK